MEREPLTVAYERERRRRVAELAENNGSDWMAAFAPGSFGCHELLDRTNLVGDLLEEQVLNHPACVANPEWYAHAATAVTILRDLYQHIGASHGETNVDVVEAEAVAGAPSRRRSRSRRPAH